MSTQPIPTEDGVDPESFSKGYDAGFKDGEGIKPVSSIPSRRVTLVSSAWSWGLALIFGLIIPLFFSSPLGQMLNVFEPPDITSLTEGPSVAEMKQAVTNVLLIIWSVGLIYLLVIIYQFRVVATAISWPSAAAALMFTISAPVSVVVFLPLVLEAYFM